MAGTLQPVPSASGRTSAALAPWLPLVAGSLALWVPTLFGLFAGAWSTESQAHGPLILGVSVWLMARNWRAMIGAARPAQSDTAAWVLLGAALLMYVLGRSQEILVFEVGSLVLALAATLWLTLGSRALATQWFPLFFMLFMVPLPGTVVDALTLPMKLAVSNVVEFLLYWAGYPIARTGVILQIGFYQLLVADACAGLQTLFTLESIGLLYLNLVRHASVARNIALAILIVPISFAANVIRVIVLTLITFHLGDEAGQGFLHGFAGMVLFVSALVLIIAADGALRAVVRRATAGSAA
ncbi:exosortase B [Noviherbaspirillum aridicola]|uniref:Exosortase n=1 Tax=Noviherbaspirillum aridicola TaxID=2849687 RepID=A0ABQ4Q688_9BURK|nr:exosortase B [Noviherbaspirillum aridicola]GIZ52506.1 exosortase [Noviherbaspirillum aridicola]